MNSKQGKEFIKALDALVAEKGIDKAIAIEAMEAGMANAYKRNTGVVNVKAKVNSETGQIRLFTFKNVVEEVEEGKEDEQISLDDAKKIVDDIEVGETIDTEVKIIPEDFGRVAVLSAKQIIVQKVKEAEKKGSGEMLRYSETLDKQTFYYAILLEDGKILRVSRSIDSVLGYLQSGITLVAVLVLAIIGIAFFVIQNQTKKLVEPINTMDLEHPLRHVEYEELRPLLMRVHEQNRQIAGQIQELKERHEEYLAITENMKDGLVVASQTEVLSINKAAQELFQVQASDCIRRPISRVSRNKELKKALDGALAGEHIETVLETHGRFYQLLANPVKVTGKTYGAVIMVWDITEKNAAEQMRREFSANVSHELKTPLMSISGYAELIENGMVQPADIPEFASRIHQEANRLTALVQDIIQLSKLEEGTSQMQEEVVDLYELTEDIGATLHHAAKKKDITMKIEGATQEITGVRQILYEMLYNLMDNGIKYNVEHGILWVRMWKTTDKIYWQVEDTGIGIAKEEQERVYERFYRVDKSHSRQTGGTGLGLSIVKHGAALHHAQIRTESQPGQGTKITIGFPLDPI